MPWPTSLQPCIRCGANCSDLPFTDNRKVGSAWLGTVWSRAGWLASHPFHHPLFDLPFVSIWTVCLDWMHVKHLGVDRYYLGSCLWLLCYQILPHEPEDALQFVFDQCKQWWGERGISTSDTYSKLKLSMFTNPESPRSDFPQLKGKAAEIKLLIAPLRDIFLKWMEPDDVAHQWVQLGLKASARLEDVLMQSAAAHTLPEPVQSEF